MNEQLIDFYNHRGYLPGHYVRLETILQWSDEEWEKCHDFIQWLFPSNEASRFNPNAPILDRVTSRWLSKRNLIKAFDRFLEFLGIEPAGPSYFFNDEKVKGWYTPDNHNLLRITRVLKCMMLCGCYQEARQLEGALYQIDIRARFHGWEPISKETWKFWNQAIAPKGLMVSEYDPGLWDETAGLNT